LGGGSSLLLVPSLILPRAIIHHICISSGIESTPWRMYVPRRGQVNSIEYKPPFCLRDFFFLPFFRHIFAQNPPSSAAPLPLLSPLLEFRLTSYFQFTILDGRSQLLN
jgi:hypothetical protein